MPSVAEQPIKTKKVINSRIGIIFKLAIWGFKRTEFFIGIQATPVNDFSNEPIDVEW